ncbi:MAG: glycosyltransferase family 4 protein [Acidobacteriota bacterium]
MKIALVVQRYGLEINGGAEYHARLIAEHLSKHLEVEILTTCAIDYITWKNHYEPKFDFVNNIPVRRFRVLRQRNPVAFGRLQDRLLRYPHTQRDELQWLRLEGPWSPSLIRYIEKNRDNYDYFAFFSYRYYHSYYGLAVVPHKALLVPTAERDDITAFSIWKPLFLRPRAIVYNSHEEREMIHALSQGVADVPGDVVGVGSNIPEKASPADFTKKYSIQDRYLVYVGRIDENKGCKELFDFFQRYVGETGSKLKLVLVGSSVMELPRHPSILPLGFLDDEDKFNAIAGADLLMMPSQYESLSMVTLEAWGLGRPVLANGRCDVLKGQCLRSNGGLFYENYEEFVETLRFLEHRERLRQELGFNGRRYFRRNYSWDVIEKKYLDLIELLEKQDPKPPAPPPRPFWKRWGF